MKHILTILSVFFIGLGYLLPTAASAKPFIIVVDAGHGGKDEGASGKKKLKEKDINLAVALKLGAKLKQMKGVEVHYTRTTDVFVPLDERAQIANRLNANLFISVHTNSAENRTARGTEVWTFSATQNIVAVRENSVIELEENYKKKYDGFDPNSSESYIQWNLIASDFGYSGQSKELASSIATQLKKYSGLKNRGIHQAGFWVLKYSKMPGVLVEVGYVSNPDEEKFLRKNTSREKLATAIYKAVVQYKAEYDKKEAEKAKDEKADASKKVSNNKSTTNSSSKSTSTNKKETTKKSSTTTSDDICYRVQFYTGPRKDVNCKAFKHCVPAREANLGNGKYSYTYGKATTYAKAKELLEKVHEDFSDAFLVVYKNGERLSRDEAKQYLK